jgi:hypothetical protein
VGLESRNYVYMEKDMYICVDKMWVMDESAGINTSMDMDMSFHTYVGRWTL